jgi:RNA polymerase sigma-70 factor (ECF subfamily)
MFMSQVDPKFEEYRPALSRLAYRMLGSQSDADDVMQEAYLRWTQANRQSVKSPRAYLHSVVTHLCIDQRKTIEERKQTYVGPWLPEPIVEAGSAAPQDRVEAAESVSMALLLILESLSPTERAAYLLRRIFDYPYDEIAEILGKPEPGCRQLVSRAEVRILERRPRFEADPAKVERLTEAFIQACGTGDLQGLVQLLAADAVLYSDGGGKVAAALAPIRGADHIARFFLGIMKKAPPGLEIGRVRVNGQPGLLVVLNGEIVNLLTFDVVDGRLSTCFIVRNPEKLARIGIARVMPEAPSGGQ